MISIQVEAPETTIRLDHFLAQQHPEYTRSYLQKLIIARKVSVNNVINVKSSTLLIHGDTVSLESFEQPPRSIAIEGYENFFKKRLIHEDEHFMVINKPAGLIVHPSSSTSPVIALSDVLTKYYPETATVGEEGRPGIVHRLDGDTSGIILVARTQHGYDELTKLFRSRTIAKQYYAVVKGHPEQSGHIHEPLQRHPIDPRRMTCAFPQLLKKSTDNDTSREAHTEYEVVEYFDDSALIRVMLHTGRTHQIRVHMAHSRHSIIGDDIYGNKDHRIKRQALHAYSLAFKLDGKDYSFTCPLPGDFRKLLPLDVIKNI
jgi:23S rRNA pseudouridine1911/1915/1917 synthase